MLNRFRALGESIRSIGTLSIANSEGSGIVHRPWEGDCGSRTVPASYDTTAWQAVYLDP
jgi:hypothetical protein